MTMPDGPDVVDLDIRFPARPEYVRTVRHAVAALARLHGADEDAVEDIKLGVSEACTTAVLATAEAGPEPVDVTAQASEPHHLLVSVLDRGAHVEREVAGPPDEISTEELPFERALSLPIVRGLVEEVAVRPRAGGGATMEMRFSLRSGQEG